MRTELTITELEAETVELLPARETLHFHWGNNSATINATNTSTAVNAYTVFSHAHSTALQAISVHQG